MERKFKLLPPTMPNFVFMEMPPRPKEEGIDFDRGKISITDFTREEAEEYGELMKQTFIKHWEFKTSNP
jgi:hypothetical protein